MAHRKSRLVLAGSATLALALTLAGNSGLTAAASAPAAPQDPVARGHYLAIAADCEACHTAPGGKPFAGGYAINSPMGTIYASNITPSPSHGIGGWSKAEFAGAVREGVSPHGNLYPAMPYDAYAQLTDADISDLFAYFTKAVAPVDTAPAQKTSLSFPFNIRPLMKGWNLLYRDGQRFAPRPGEDPQVTRGRYLVDAVEHCSTCHTPRTALMATDKGQYLAGAQVDGWNAPNLTSDKISGLGGWSDAELIAYLQNGHAKGKAVAAGPMGEAVTHSLSRLTDADRMAIVRYLRSVPAMAATGEDKPAYSYGKPVNAAYDFDQAAARETLDAARQARAKDPAVEARRGDAAGVSSGAVLYGAACASCHQPTGSGIGDNYYPSLYHSTAVGARTPENLVKTILEGVDRTGADGHIAMPGFKADMSDAQVAEVANFVAQHFGNPAMQVDAATVAKLRAGETHSWLATLGPWLAGLPLLVIAALAFRLWRRRRKPSPFSG
jgi:mono/diheme cytochrome c family protein